MSNSDYDPYIAQNYRDDADDTEAEGDERLAEGNEKAAAKKYREAADHLRDYEEYTGKSRTKEINRLEQKASNIQGSSSAEPDSDTTDNNGEIDFGEETDQLRSRVGSFKTDTDADWDDIGGLAETKDKICHEIGIGSLSGLPNAAQPAGGVLLFGPPGTGKTLLASAVAGGTDTTFFNVKLGGLLSKWQGESAQLIATLFAVAREHTPAVIFIDEVDALTQSRSGSSDSSSRRVLNALLTELDGIDKDDDGFLMVIGSSNRPMDLDDAVVRRFDTRIYVPLPDVDGATEIVRIHTEKGGISFDGTPEEYAIRNESPPDDIARTIGSECVDRGFSGSDIENLCKRAISKMIREMNPNLAQNVRSGLEEMSDVEGDFRPLQPDDFQVAFDTVSASVPESSLKEFEAWNEQFGSG